MGLFFYIALLKLNCCILDFRWTKWYYFDPLMISCLHLRPKLQQMAFLAWNQSAGNKSYGIRTTSSLAQTASFNCLGDRVAAMSVTELDVHCFLQGCPHLNIPVSLLQKGLAELFTADRFQS